MAEGKILVVDDEEIARLTLSQILRLEGFAVRSVEHGNAALDALKEHEYDLMILDLKMPGMGGMAVLRQATKDYPMVRVIVLTAYGSLDTAVEALRNHAHDYLLKPANPKQIIETVLRVLAEPPRPAASLEEELQEQLPIRGRIRFIQLPSGAVLDWNRRLISWQDRMILLTPIELRIFEMLCQDPGKVVSHADLVFGVQGYELEREEAAKILRPVVSRLRQKLSMIPGARDWIQTTRGAGYLIEEDISCIESLN